MRRVTPFLWFHGRVEEAMKFYGSIFQDSRIVSVTRKGGKFFYGTFRIAGQEMMVLDGGPHYKLTPAFSLFVPCRTQREVDRYWAKLAKGGKILGCGWLTDRYGLTWQIVPTRLPKMLCDEDPAKAERVMKAMLKMRKLDIRILKRAHAGR